MQRKSPPSRPLFESLECRRLLALVPVMVAKLGPGSYDPSPAIFANFGDTAFLRAATPATGTEFWETDGTAEGTVLVKDLNPGEAGDLVSIHDLGGKLLICTGISNEGVGLFTSDGTTEGTVRIPNVSFQNNLQYRIVIDGELFFSTNDGVHGQELWASDGTEDGTRLIKDVKSGPESSQLQHLTKVGDTLFFLASDGVHGFELWKSDGTEEGTVMVKDSRAEGDFYVYGLTAVGDTLYFVGNDGLTGRELWKSDGTGAGTVRITDAAPGPDSWTAANLTNVNGTLFFSAHDGALNAGLYKSDGTSQGTVRVKQIRDPSAINQGALGGFANANGTLYFSGNDGISGAEPWVSDGTEAGTRMIKDIRTVASRPFGPDSAPQEFTYVDGLVYFVAIDNVSGHELWVTDGTSAGTQRVADIRPGGDSSTPHWLTTVNGTLYFGADDGVHGRELWRLVSDSVEGDTDSDLDVDITDLNNVRNNFGGLGLGDTDGDQDVDINDLNNVRNNFGRGSSSPTPITHRSRLTRPADGNEDGGFATSRIASAVQHAVFRDNANAKLSHIATPSASIRKRMRAVDQLFALL